MQTEVVGVVGLGAMGVPMAANLLRQCGSVGISGRGRDRYRDLIDRGAQWHDTPASLARSSSVIVLMLPDLPEVESVLAGPEGILSAEPDDLLLVISSTSSPVGVRELGERLAARSGGSVRLVDAPVSGGVEGAAQASLSIMVGGDPEDVARVMPVLRACGTPVHLGPLGAGQVAKACNQLIVTATMTALGEAAVLADRSGLDLAALFELFAGGYANSRMLETRGERIVTERYEPAARARYLLKDLGFAQAVADATQTRPVMVPALLRAFEELVERGLGDLDMSVTRRFIAERSEDPPGEG